MSISSVGFEIDDASAGDEVSQLQAAIDRKEVTLQRESRLGYLRELLVQLKISPDSQIRVQGIKGLPTGISFPIKEGYVTLRATLTEGAIGTIVVGGTIYGVYYTAKK